MEDTYFSPWKDSFIVEEHTSVKVKVNEHKQSTRPIVEVKVSEKGDGVINKEKNINVYAPIKEMSNICKKFGVSKSTISYKKNDFREIVKEYFASNPEYTVHKNVILNGLRHFLK